jgi:hypothetical protein
MAFWQSRFLGQARTLHILIAAGAVLWALGVLLPDTPNISSGVGRLFVGVMSTAVPAISRFSANSPIRELIQLYMSIVWTFVVAAVSIIVLRQRFPFDDKSYLPEGTKWKIFWTLLLLGVAPVILMLYFGVKSPNGPDGVRAEWFSKLAWFAQRSRTFLPVYGPLVFGVATASIWVLLGIVRNFRRLWLTGGDIK